MFYVEFYHEKNNSKLSDFLAIPSAILNEVIWSMVKNYKDLLNKRLIFHTILDTLSADPHTHVYDEQWTVLIDYHLFH